LRQAYEEAGNAILAVDRRDAVYSVHDYPTHVTGFAPDSGPDKDAMAEQAFGYVATQDLAPLYTGEWAADRLPGDNQAYADGFVAFYDDPKHGPASTSYWMWGVDYGCPEWHHRWERRAQAGADGLRATAPVLPDDERAAGDERNDPIVPIAGSDAPELYNGERYGVDGDGQAAAFHYRFAMKAGRYTA
jgi:hypothetical protein